MNQKSYREWKFLMGPREDKDGAEGLAVTPQGGIELVEGENAVRQSIRLLLSTIPGERVMRPDYGCDLYKVMFGPNDQTTAGLAIHYVRKAIAKWEPRVQVLKLDATYDNDFPERLNIVLDYRVLSTLRTEQLVHAMDISGKEI